MKTASRVVFLISDSYGVAISDSLQPCPDSYLQKTEVAFGLSLEKYGIANQKASGKIVNFVDGQGCPKVSILQLENCDPPIAACAVNEVLATILAENSLSRPEFIVPYLVGKTINCTMEHQNVIVLGAQVGPATDLINSLTSNLQKLPLNFQVSSELLACLLQLVRVLELPTVLLVGSGSERQEEGTKDQEPKALLKVVDFLASQLGLCFSKDAFYQNQVEKSKGNQEPWRALYG